LTHHSRLKSHQPWYLRITGSYSHIPLARRKTATPPIPAGAQKILYTKGNVGRMRGWWRTGTDKPASYGLDTEVWISQDSTISNSSILALEAPFQMKFEKCLPDMHSDGVDGSKGSAGMGALYPTIRWVGGCNRASSSSRAEFAAACLAPGHENSLTHNQPIAVLTDSKGFMTVSSNWVGEGKDPLLHHSPDGDILACIIKVLHQRVGLGLFTMMMKDVY